MFLKNKLNKQKKRLKKRRKEILHTLKLKILTKQRDKTKIPWPPA